MIFKEYNDISRVFKNFIILDIFTKIKAFQIFPPHISTFQPFDPVLPLEVLCFKEINNSSLLLL